MFGCPQPSTLSDVAKDKLRAQIEFLSDILGEDVLLQLLGMDAALLNGLLAESAGDPNQVFNFSILVPIRSIVDLGLQLMKSDELRTWMIKPNDEFNGVSPLEFIFKQEPFTEYIWRPRLEQVLSFAL